MRILLLLLLFVISTSFIVKARDDNSEKIKIETEGLFKDGKYWSEELQGWVDQEGNIFHYRTCSLKYEKLCPAASFRDDQSRIHYVQYCALQGDECCGCNTIDQPIGEHNGTVQYTKQGSCFACPYGQKCLYKTTLSGMTRMCVIQADSSSNSKNMYINYNLIVLLSIVSIVLTLSGFNFL